MSHQQLAILGCAVSLFTFSQRSDSAQNSELQSGSRLNVILATEQNVYMQSELIRVTVTFTNASAHAVTVFGPFMIRNAGVCGILSVDGYWAESAPAELVRSEMTTAKDYETPREVVIEPFQSHAFTRVLLIPHGVKDILKDGKNIIDASGLWSVGTHRLSFTYTCSLFRPNDSIAPDPFEILGISNPSQYWQGRLQSDTVEVEIR